jgi:hypothetical protein
MFVFLPAKRKVLYDRFGSKQDLKDYLVGDFLIYFTIMFIISIVFKFTTNNFDLFESVARNTTALILAYLLSYFSLKSYFNKNK